MAWVGQDQFWGWTSRPFDSFWDKSPEIKSPLVLDIHSILDRDGGWDQCAKEAEHQGKISEAEQEPNLLPFPPPDHIRWYHRTRLSSRNRSVTNSQSTLPPTAPRYRSFISSEEKPMLDSRYWPGFQRRQLFNLGQLDIARIAPFKWHLDAREHFRWNYKELSLENLR